jgi:hypothetical protein
MKKLLFANGWVEILEISENQTKISSIKIFGQVKAAMITGPVSNVCRMEQHTFKM